MRALVVSFWRRAASSSSSQVAYTKAFHGTVSTYALRYAQEVSPAAVRRLNAVPASVKVAVWWMCCASAGALGMYVSIDQLVMAPLGPSLASQWRRVTAG